MRGSSRSSATATMAVRFYRGHGRHSRQSRFARGYRSRGVSIFYMVLMFVALAGIVSLAIDVGRIRLAREELQTAADAAACAGARTLPDTDGAQEVIDNTLAAAFENPCIDNESMDKTHLNQRTNPGVLLDADEDVTFGIWDDKARTFTPLEDDPKTESDERLRANAVRANARRLTKRGDPVKLMVAPIVGAFKSDVEREAIATIKGGSRKFGFVGLNWVNAAGQTATIDSVSPPNDNAWLGSNGDINLNNADVYGDVRAGIGADLIQKPNSLVTGWAANLDYTLNFPPVPWAPTTTTVTSKDITPPTVVQTGGNILLGNNKAKITPKFTPPVYYFTGASDAQNRAWWDSGGGSTTITGPATIYLNGDFVQSGKGNSLTIDSTKGKVTFYVNGNFTQDTGTINSKAGGLDIIVTKPNTSVTLTGNGVQNGMHVYAPLSDVTVNGTPGFTGWIIGKTLTFKGTVVLHDDETNVQKDNWKISLVK